MTEFLEKLEEETNYKDIYPEVYGEIYICTNMVEDYPEIIVKKGYDESLWMLDSDGLELNFDGEHFDLYTLDSNLASINAILENIDPKYMVDNSTNTVNNVPIRLFSVELLMEIMEELHG